MWSQMFAHMLPNIGVPTWLTKWLLNIDHARKINLVLCNWALSRFCKASDFTAGKSYKLSLPLPPLSLSWIFPQTPLFQHDKRLNPRIINQFCKMVLSTNLEYKWYKCLSILWDRKPIFLRHFWRAHSIWPLHSQGKRGWERGRGGSKGEREKIHPSKCIKSI